jgi:hypothetical protein
MERKSIKLSHEWTRGATYLWGILGLIASIILIPRFNELNFTGQIMGGIMFALIDGFAIYLFLYGCEAKIIGDEIVLKKEFRPAKSYSFDKIGKIKSFRLKTTKFVIVEMQNDNNTTEKYVIMNAKSSLAFEDKDAEEILKNIRSSIKKNLK